MTRTRATLPQMVEMEALARLELSYEAIARVLNHYRGTNFNGDGVRYYLKVKRGFQHGEKRRGLATVVEHNHGQVRPGMNGYRPPPSGRRRTITVRAGTPLDAILAGRAFGIDYPSAEQIEAYKAAFALAKEDGEG